MAGHGLAEATPFIERLWPGHDDTLQGRMLPTLYENA